MKLSVVTAICGGVAISKQWLSETMARTAEPRQLCIAFNGCTVEEINEVLAATGDYDVRAVVLDEPAGSAAAFNQAASVASGDVLALLHNDLMIRDESWDLHLLSFFEGNPDAGIVGFAGAKQLGRADIYRSPYQLTQLARAHVYTSLEDWPSHGFQATEPVEVAVLDGLALCLRRELWQELEGFDEGIGPHHLYDIDLSLRALAGHRNYVIPVACRHISGQTANASRYQSKFGPDAEVHRRAHENFYAKWLNRLPVAV